MPYTSQSPFIAGPLSVASLEQLRTNLAETAAAKATTAGRHFVATGVGSIAERAVGSDVVDSITTTSSTAYVSAGPTVTLTTGPQALIFLYTYLTIDTNSETAYYTVQVSGATTQTANDNRAVRIGRYTVQLAMAASSVILSTGLTPGSNTFTAMMRVTNGAATGTFASRRIAVLPF